MPTRRSSSMVFLRASSCVTDWCSRMASMTWLPIVCTGEKELMGSWKIMAISLPRILRISEPVGSRRARSTTPFPLAPDRSGEWKRICPESIRPGCGMIRRTECAVIDLPQPLSPTTPSTSPRRMVRSTPSTARTVPSSSGKDTRKSLISNSTLLSKSHNLLAGIRISRVAHTITDETECHHRYDHERNGCEEPRIQGNRLYVLRVLQQHTPGNHRRPQAQTHERQGGLCQDHIGERDREIHNNVTQEGGKQVPGDDAGIGAAGNARRDDKVFFPQREQLTPHPPRQMRPSQKAEQDRDREVNALGRP